MGTAKGLRSRLRSHGKKSRYSTLKKKGAVGYMESGLTGKRKATHYMRLLDQLAIVSGLQRLKILSPQPWGKSMVSIKLEVAL